MQSPTCEGKSPCGAFDVEPAVRTRPPPRPRSGRSDVYVAIVLCAALLLTALITGMCLLGGFIAAGLMPGVALTVRLRIELYVSSVACLALMGSFWLSLAHH